MKVLVTGGAGFIGSYCVQNLVKEGHSVVTYNRNPSTYLLKSFLAGNDMAQVKVEQGDVADLDQLSYR